MDILEKAEKLLNEGKPRKALDLLKKTKKDDAFAEYLKAEASRVGGDFHAAITHYDNARRGHIEDPELAVNILNGMPHFSRLRICWQERSDRRKMLWLYALHKMVCPSGKPFGWHAMYPLSRCGDCSGYSCFWYSLLGLRQKLIRL